MRSQGGMLLEDLKI